MKKFSIKMLTLSLLLLLAIPVPVFAASSDEGLSNVTFHDNRLDDGQAGTLRAGVARLWSFVEPYAGEQGLEKFPRADIYGYPSREALSGVCGPVSGCAYPGRAYVAIISELSAVTPAHESMHLIQYAISGRDIGPYCISEGAAEWYTYKSVRQIPFRAILDDMKSTMLQEEALPAISRMVTERQFKGVKTTIAYPTCFLAFELLMQLEGGEEQGNKAYFQYLSELRRNDWHTAFSTVFGDSFEVFEKRFAIYVDSGFENWKLPAEIKHDRFIDELLSCKRSGLWAQKVCIR